MKRSAKYILASCLCFVCYLLIPFLSARFAGMAGMGICLILFFAADPLICVVIGILAGTDLRHLWWMPLAAAAAMPLCFSLCMWEFIPELFIYAMFYLLFSAVSMMITWLICRKK